MPCRVRYSKRNDFFSHAGCRIWREACCGAECEGDVCADCLKRQQTRSGKKRINPDDKAYFDHGLVGGDYPPQSQLYGSMRYLEIVKAHGEPKAADLESAKTALAMAKAKAKVEDGKTSVVAVTAPAVAPAVETKPKVVRRGKAVDSSAEPTAAPEKKARKPRAKKETKAPEKNTVVATTVASVPAITALLASMTLVENTDEPIPIDEVEQVILRPFTVGSKKYYRDADTCKLFERRADNKRGPYVGRWDADTQTIDTEAPNSDVD